MNDQFLQQSIRYGLPLFAILPSLFNHPRRISMTSGIFIVVLLGVALAGFYELDRMTKGGGPAFVGLILYIWIMMVLYVGTLMVKLLVKRTTTRLTEHTKRRWKTPFAIVAALITALTTYGVTCTGQLPDNFAELFYLWALVLMLTSRALSSTNFSWNA